MIATLFAAIVVLDEVGDFFLTAAEIFMKIRDLGNYVL